MKYLSLFLFSFLLISSCKDKPLPEPGTDPDPIDTTTNPIDTTTNPVDTTSTDPADTLRFASYNVSMFGNTSSEVLLNLSDGNNARFQKVAEVIQRVRPDFLCLMEIDYYANHVAVNQFVQNYLATAQNGAEPIDYPYVYAVASNTGLLSEVDIDGNGSISLPNDAYGFGNFEGQYASAMLSKYPLKVDEARTFQTLLWKDKPDATLPVNTDGTPYYSQDVIDVFRLSSKNHIDMPIEVRPGKVIHALISHPTPPVFDGAEDRNGLRNRDEIGLWVDYINDAEYLTDDNGQTGGLASGEAFVVMGDLNADPVEGDSAPNAIGQLLEHPAVDQNIATGSLKPASTGGAAAAQGAEPEFDTSFFRTAS